MSLAGWYPDPSGDPGRYRYWTGTNWTAHTTGDPSSPVPTISRPPAAGGREAGTERAADTQPGRRRPVIGLLALLLVVILVAGVFFVRGLLARDGTVAGPDPSSTVSGWDDSSPFPTATPTPTATRTPTPTPTRRTPTPSRAPTPSAAEPAPMEACPIGDPAARESHPNDGRIHGGALSFAPHTGWEDGGDYLDGLSWTYDVAGEEQSTEPSWAAIFAVGALHTTDGFTGARQSADGVLQCITTSGYYSDVQSTKETTSRPISVDGRSGWELQAEVRVDEAGVDVDGDVVDVIVVDTGARGSWSLFVGAVPIGDNTRIGELNATVADLRVG